MRKIQGKQKAVEKEPEQDNGLKPKERWEFWLGIGNLIATMIIGIGIAVFLNYRNERIQRELIELQANLDRQLYLQQVDAQKQLIETQAEIDRQSQIANIEVTKVCAYYWGCDGVLQVRNLGPANARNLRIILYAPNVSDIWLSFIRDIEAFQVRIPSPLVDFTLNKTTIDTLANSNLQSGPNALTILIEDLQAEQSFLIVTKLASSLPTEKYDIVRPVRVHKTEELFYLDTLRDYFNQTYPVARFKVDFECDNCDRVTAPGSFLVSSVDNWHWEFTNQTETIDDLNISISYLLPQGVYRTPQTASLDLKVTSQYGAVLLKEIAP